MVYKLYTRRGTTTISMPCIACEGTIKTGMQRFFISISKYQNAIAFSHELFHAFVLHVAQGFVLCHCSMLYNGILSPVYSKKVAACNILIVLFTYKLKGIFPNVVFVWMFACFCVYSPITHTHVRKNARLKLSFEHWRIEFRIEPWLTSSTFKCNW